MTKQRKIVLIGPAHPLRGGLATFNERLIKEYLSLGYDASIYTFSLQYPSILFPGKTQFSSEPPPKDIPIKVAVNSINPFNWWKIGRELKKLNPDVVIVKFWMPFMAPCFGTICRIVKKNGHTKVISIIDNIIPHEKRPGDKILANYWVKCVDGFVAMSKSVLNELDLFDKTKPKLFCSHPLYDNFGEPKTKVDSRSYLKLNQDFNYLLFFGFIRDYKGLDILLKAFGDDRIKSKKLKLLVAGEFYTDSKPYLDLIESLQLRDSVIMSNDFIPDSEVVNYFCAADIVVQPYKSATQSGVTQIAYHFDKPMIITNVGGLAEFVPDGKVGFVTEPDEKQLADAILRYYDEQREEEFSKNAANEKKKYTWGKMVDAIDELVSW